MKKSTLITELSLEDFLKLNLTAYEHRKHYYNKNGEEIDSSETGEFVFDSKGGRHWVAHEGIYSRIIWDKVKLNDIVKENIEFSNEQGFKNRCICVAIHTEPSKEVIKEYMKNFGNYYSYSGIVTRMTETVAYEQLLFEYSYLDKWLTRNGNQTYLIRCDVPHLYVERRKFCTHDDYFEVPKRETKAIYLIRY